MWKCKICREIIYVSEDNLIYSINIHTIMKLHATAFVLLIIGGINWLLVGIAGWDVGQLFGGMSAPASKVIYILVGLAAIYEVVTHKSNCKMCDKITPPSQNTPAA